MQRVICTPLADRSTASATVEPELDRDRVVAPSG
jgi:hypothetical protein